MAEALLMKNIVKVYSNGVMANKDVTLQVNKGEIHALSGENGAGKSTFLKILSGALEPSKGDVTMSPGERLSVLEQDHFKFDEFYVMETVIMGNPRLY